MASTVWKGHLTFGLVSFPVKLFTAARSENISFNQLHKCDHSRIKQVLYCQAEDKPVPRSELVKGFEYEKDRYVVIEESEIGYAFFAFEDAVRRADLVIEHACRKIVEQNPKLHRIRRDLRELPLIERKRILCRIVPHQDSRLLYVSHIEGQESNFSGKSASAICKESLRSGDTGRISRATRRVG